MEVLIVNVPQTLEHKIRLDVYLATHINVSRAQIKKTCLQHKVLLNGKIVLPNKILKGGEEIKYLKETSANFSFSAENLKFEIIYQDANLLVINKPQGLVVHEGVGTRGRSLVNALLAQTISLATGENIQNPGIVHRIDKNTSGLLVVAKDKETHSILSKEIETKICQRSYLALLEGRVPEHEGKIETLIGRDPKNPTRMKITPRGKRAITLFKVLKYYQNYTLVKFTLLTGRTHQIRVHAQYLKHPIVGDNEYGLNTKKFNLSGQLLHAFNLNFVHPVTKKFIKFYAPLPKYFKDILLMLDTYH